MIPELPGSHKELGSLNEQIAECSKFSAFMLKENGIALMESLRAKIYDDVVNRGIKQLNYAYTEIINTQNSPYGRLKVAIIDLDKLPVISHTIPNFIHRLWYLSVSTIYGTSDSRNSFAVPLTKKEVNLFGDLVLVDNFPDPNILNALTEVNKKIQNQDYLKLRAHQFRINIYDPFMYRVSMLGQEYGTHGFGSEELKFGDKVYTIFLPHAKIFNSRGGET